MIALRPFSALALGLLAGCVEPEGLSTPAAGAPTEPPAALQGVVYRAAGGFGEGALVLVLPPGETAAGEARARATAGPGGAFCVAELPEGAWDVRASLETASAAVLGVEAAPGEVHRLVMELP
jgi:hypothetical protein